MAKYLDELGLKKVVQSLVAKLDLKFAGKVSSVSVTDATQITVDNTDTMNPKLGLASGIVTKITTLWTLTNNGTGMTTISDTEIDQIITDVFN